MFKGNFYIKLLEMKEIIVAFLISFFVPIYPQMIAVGVLVSFDFIFGIWAAYKKGEDITSSKMRNTLSKGIVYMFAIITAHLSESYLVQAIPITQAVVSLVGIIEIKSLFENYSKITGVPFLKSLQKLFDKGVKSISEDKDNKKEDPK